MTKSYLTAVLRVKCEDRNFRLDHRELSFLFILSQSSRAWCVIICAIKVLRKATTTCLLATKMLMFVSMHHHEGLFAFVALFLLSFSPFPDAHFTMMKRCFQFAFGVSIEINEWMKVTQRERKEEERCLWRNTMINRRLRRRAAHHFVLASARKQDASRRLWDWWMPSCEISIGLCSKKAR